MQMRRCLLVSLALLICLGSLIAVSAYYRDSFTYKTSLSLGSGKTGVVFHDRWRATGGYHLLDNYAHELSCELIDPGGEWDGQMLPGSFCAILDDGSYVASSLNQHFSFFGSDGIKKWSLKVFVHHDIWIDQKHGKIFILYHDRDKLPGDKHLTRRDGVLGYDYSGRLIFEWRFRSHKAEYDSMLGEATKRYFYQNMYRYTHFNSVQFLPPNPWADKDPAFREGNVLVNDLHHNVIFIIDQDSQKIVWSYRPKEWGAAHTVRMTDSGMVALFANYQLKQSESELRDEYSSIRMFNPMTLENTANITLNPKTDFYTLSMGSMQLLPRGHFMVTNSLSGSAFEFDSKGRILWEWISPKNAPDKPFPTYRVTWLPYDLVDKTMARWLRIR